MGYSKISVLTLMTALGTSAFFGDNASAQQYSPVSVDSNVQVNWDVADGYGGQTTVPQYLSPSVSREHIVMPGGDLIYPETRPQSAFLANDQFSSTGNDSYDGGFETVVIDGAGGNAVPSQSQFYGVPGVSDTAMSPSMDDGANQTIALRQPEATTAPRTKPAAPTTVAAAAPSSSASSSGSAPVPLTKPAPAPAASTMTETASAPAAPATETTMVEPPEAPPLPSTESKASEAPAAPVVEPIGSGSEIPVAPTSAPDTTSQPAQMAEVAPAAPKPEPKPAPAAAPAAEEASLPPASKAPAASTSTGAGEYSLGFASDSFELTSAAQSELNQVIAAMSNDDSLRIQLQAYAEGDSANASKARRLSLSRALQVRSYLIDKGVRSTRIDVRALGANVPSGPADRVDIKTVQR